MFQRLQACGPAMGFGEQQRKSWSGHFPNLIGLSIVLIAENVVGVDVVEWFVVRA